MDPILIDAGSVADFGFTGGASWGPSNDPAMGNLDGVYQTLRYGVKFSYDIPIDIGLWLVQVFLLEPNKTAPGQRVFTVDVNGRRASGIDLFRLVGVMTPYALGFLVTTDSSQPDIKLSFSGQIGNAVVSGIQVMPQSWSGSGPLS